MDVLNDDFSWYLTLGEGMLRGNEQRIADYCIWVLSLTESDRDRHYRCFSDLYYSVKCHLPRESLLNLSCPCDHCRNFADDAIAALDYFAILPSKQQDYIPVTRAPGFVYLMRHGRAGTVKIGYSKNPKEREETLQAEDPDLNLLASWPGTTDDERALHTRFADLRTRGEWFRLSPNDVGGLIEEFGGILV